MSAIHYLPAFLLAASLIILVPGPAAAVVAGRVRNPKRLAWLAVLVTLSGLGFSVLEASWPMLTEVITVCGGLYVAYVALAMLNSPMSHRHRLFAKGLLLSSALILLA